MWVLYLSGWSIAEIRDKLKKDFYTKGWISTLLKPHKQYEDMKKLEAKGQEKNQQWAQPSGAALNQHDEQEAAAEWPQFDDTTDEMIDGTTNESETESPPRWLAACSAPPAAPHAASRSCRSTPHSAPPPPSAPPESD